MPNIFENIVSFSTLFKIAFLSIMVLYMAFSFIVLNQVRSMNKIISQARSSTFINAFSVLNVLFALSLFLAAIVIL